jgi:hypothetical protein
VWNDGVLREIRMKYISMTVSGKAAPGYTAAAAVHIAAVSTEIASGKAACSVEATKR